MGSSGPNAFEVRFNEPSMGPPECQWPAPGGSTWRRRHAGLRYRLASGLQAQIASLLETLMGQRFDLQPPFVALIELRRLQATGGVLTLAPLLKVGDR